MPKETKITNEEPQLDSFILLALIVHLTDLIFTGFTIQPQTIILRTVLYIGLAFLGHFLLKHQDWYQTIKEFWKPFSVPMIFIPLAWVLFNQFEFFADKAPYVSAVALGFPVIIYWALGKSKDIPKEHRGIMIKLANAYYVFMFFIVIINVAGVSLYSLSTIEAMGTTGMDYKIGWYTFKTYIVDQIKNTINGVTTSLSQTTNNLLNNTLGSAYKGRVEKGEERTGFIIENFETTSRKQKIENLDEMTLIADITAHKLTGETKVELECEFEKTGGITDNEVYKGKIRTSQEQGEKITLNFDEYTYSKSVICELQDHEKTRITDGAYKATIKGTTNYETEAYVEYTIIAQDDLLDFGTKEERDKAISNLNIQPIPEAKYTEGPIILGMLSSQDRNPKYVKRTKTNSIPIGMDLTTSREYANARVGEIKKVNEITLELPPEFDLTCSTGESAGTATNDITGFKIFRYNFIGNQYTNTNIIQHRCDAILDENGVNQLIRKEPGKLGVQKMILFGTADFEYEFQRISQSFIVDVIS
ncbi:hypothetical protein K9L97_04700 [Candidatus Woesearchaeota archaeon]|nr:hypothetical protein [Candidatus Woesearchaeota archaeon]